MVLGAGGQVGSALVHALTAQGAKVTAVRRSELDAADTVACETYIQQKNAQSKLDYLFNAVAYTAVDNAESEPELADTLNHKLPATLARLSQTLDFTLVHYSTDYVYPGNGETPYTESSSTKPLSVYGKTKLAGDEAVLKGAPNALIGRTSWVYAKTGKNFVNTMLRLAQTRSELTVVDDQIGAPTSARYIADTTLELLSTKQQGVFHIVPSGFTSWAGFAREIFALHQCDVQVHGIPSSDYPTPAKRPLNSRLSTAKLQQVLGHDIPDWRSVLHAEFGAAN
ncbi:MAG: dTDP-4-dehydrorhamnose reductase [Firmicutes bacterium]|nr:dTDP-4-dehydrorhamnose reductase [Bacillota bacterium]